MVSVEFMKEQIELLINNKNGVLEVIDKVLIPIALSNDNKSVILKNLEVLEKELEGTNLSNIAISLEYFVKNNDNYNKKEITIALMKIKEGYVKDINKLRKVSRIMELLLQQEII